MSRYARAQLIGGPLDGKFTPVRMYDTGPQSVIEVAAHEALSLAEFGRARMTGDEKIKIERHRYQLDNWSGDQAVYRHEPRY